ncbi:MAG: hypothetical protein JO112_08115 [Planctomycetes bacterium]|nr:hypothetical protein [Planctomycetota bacterium]
MFTPDDLKARFRDKPFNPVRIVTTTGQTYDIFHPDLVLVTRRFLEVGTPSTDDPALADQVTRVAILHITELQDLPKPGVPPNGPPG